MIDRTEAMRPPRIIAEIGVNHDGELNKAMKLIEKAAECGCDAVKFQSFKAERLAEADTPKVDYQKRSGDKGESHFEMLKRLEFGSDKLRDCMSYARKAGLEFITTPYDPESATEAYDVGARRFKVASADLNDIYLNSKLNELETEEIILATGMSTINDIKNALLIHTRARPSLLHCVSAYPCPDVDVNARSISLMKACLPEYEIGFSDHTIGTMSAVLCTALGSRLFERHFTLDRCDNGPDHYASSDPKEMKKYVDDIHRAIKILGKESKETRISEAGMASISKKAIKAKRDIAAGELITLENTYAIRPANKGVSVDRLRELISKRATRLISADSYIQIEDLEP